LAHAFRRRSSVLLWMLYRVPAGSSRCAGRQPRFVRRCLRVRGTALLRRSNTQCVEFSMRQWIRTASEIVRAPDYKLLCRERKSRGPAERCGAAGPVLLCPGQNLDLSVCTAHSNIGIQVKYESVCACMSPLHYRTRLRYSKQHHASFCHAKAKVNSFPAICIPRPITSTS
jgi:hypothetical protein